MSSNFLARTNQKLSFSQIHLGRLQQVQKTKALNKLQLIHSFEASVLFHMSVAYNAFLQELADKYSLAYGVNAQELMAKTLEVDAPDSPELRELAILENDPSSWLSKMLCAYKALWQTGGLDIQNKTAAQVDIISEIQLVQLNSEQLEPVEILAEYESWYESLSELISRLREAMQEW